MLLPHYPRLNLSLSHSISSSACRALTVSFISKHFYPPPQSQHTHLLSTALISLLHALLGHVLELRHLAFEKLMEEILKDDRHLLQLRFVVARLDDANFGDPRRLAEVKAVGGMWRRERERWIKSNPI